MRFALFLVLALLLVPALSLAQAPPSRKIDLVVTLRPGEDPVTEGPSGILAYENATAGERVQWRLASPSEQVSIEIRIEGGFEIERAQQVVPLLLLDKGERTCRDAIQKGGCDDPLFVAFPHERIWEYDHPARIYHVNGTPERAILRLGINGPANGTLVLQRDVTPPVLTQGALGNVTHFSFYTETRTDEFAIVDLQVRKLGAQTWVENPTPSIHVWQKFPIQGLTPDTEYEYRFVATDWAGNDATSEIQRIRSAPAPVLPVPRLVAISPAPNSTIQPGAHVVLQASVESPESPIDPTSLRVYFDKTSFAEGIGFDGANITYAPQNALSAGTYSVAIEASNLAGGKAVARWRFEVGGGTQATPGPAAPLVLLGLAGVSLLARRR